MPFLNNTEKIETPFEKEARERGIDLSQINEARPEKDLIPEEDFLQNASTGLISEEDFIKNHEPKSPTFTEEAFNKYLVDQPDPAAELKKLSRSQDEILQAKKAQYLFSMSSDAPISADAHIERIKKESAEGISGIIKHFPVRYSKESGMTLTMDESFAPFQEIENDYEKNGLLSTVGTQTKRVLKNLGKGTLQFMMSTPQVLYGLIQEQAEKAGVDPSYISEMESNPLLGFVAYGAKMVQKEIADRTDLDEKITGWAKKKITESKENLQKQGIVPEGDTVYDKLFFNLGSGGASLGVALALSYVTRSAAGMKMLGPVIGEWAVPALFGVMEKANLYTDLRDQGVDAALASRVSTVGGIANAVLEKWGIDNILKESSRPFLNALRTGLVEGSEEFSQDFISGFLDITAKGYDQLLKGDRTGASSTLFNKQEWTDLIDRSLYSGLIGFLTGAPAGGVGSEISKVLKERGVSDIGIEAINSRVDGIVKESLNKAFESEDLDNRKARALDESAPEILRMEAERLQAARQSRLTEKIETPFEKEARERGIDLSQIEEARPEQAGISQSRRLYERIQRRAGLIRENGKRAGGVQRSISENSGTSVRSGNVREVQGMAAGEAGQSQKVAPLQIFRTKEDVIVENTRGEKVTLKANDEYRIIPDEKDSNKVKLLDGKQVTVFTGELPKLPSDKITYLSEENQPQGGGRKRRPPAGEGYDKEWMHKASNDKIDNFIKYEEDKMGRLPIEVPPAAPEISKRQEKIPAQAETIPAAGFDAPKEKKFRPFREPKGTPQIPPDQIKKIIRENTGQLNNFINVSETTALKIKLRAEARGSKEAREYVGKIVRVLRMLQKEYKRPDLAIDYEYFRKVQDIQNGLDIKPYSPLWKLNLDELSSKLKEMNRLKKEGRQILMEKLVARKAEYDRIKSELISNVGGVKTEGKIATIHNRESIGLLKRGYAHLSRVLNTPTLMDWLDGRKNFKGAHLNEVWWQAKKCEYKEIAMKHETADRIKALQTKYGIDKNIITKVETFKDEKGIDQKFTHGEMQKVFAWAGDLDGQVNEKQIKAVHRTGIDPDMLEKMMLSLSDNEKKYVREAKQLFNENWPEMQRVSIEVDNRALRKETSYFPMEVDRDYISWGDAFESDMLQRGYQAGALEKGFRIERVDIERDVVLPLRIDDFTGSLHYNLNSHQHYIAYREFEHKLNSIMRTPDYKKAVLENKGETVWRQLSKWQDNILNPRTIYEGSNRVINELRKNISVASLSLKVLSATKQLVNIVMVPQYADLKDIFYNIQQLADPKTRGEIFRFVKNAAPDILPAKNSMWEIQELEKSIRSEREKTKIEKTFQDIRDKITPAGLYLMTHFDYIVRVATYKSVYDSAIKAGFSDMDAKRKAALFNAKSQNMQGVTDTSDLIRDRGFKSLFTQFASQAHNITTMLVYDLPESIKHKEYKRASAIGISLLLNAALMQVIGHGFRLPKDDDEADKWALDAFTDMIPLIGGGFNWAGKTLMDQPVYNPSLFSMPLKDVLERLGQASSDLSRGEYQKAAGKVVTAAGTMAGLPVPALNTFLKGRKDWKEGKTENRFRRLFASRSAMGEDDLLKGVSVETQFGKVIDQNYIDTLRRRGSKVSRKIDDIVEGFTTSGMLPDQYYKSDKFKKKLDDIKDLFEEEEFTSAVRTSIGKSIKSRMNSDANVLAWAQYMYRHGDDKEKYKNIISEIRLDMRKKQYKQLPQLAGR